MIRVVPILTGLFIILGLIVQAHGAEHPDKLYEAGKYVEAQAGYEQLGLDNPKDLKYRYNRGCAAYQNQDYQSALAAFSSVYRRAENAETRFQAAFNLGNSAFQTGDLNSAVEYYRQAVVLKPESGDARYNLEFALRELEKRNNAQQQQGQNRQEHGSQEGQPQHREGKKGPGHDQNREEPGENRQQQSNHTQQDRSSRQDAASGQPRDLSGDLASQNPLSDDAVQGAEQTMPAEILDKKKAEALLDNVREDRSKFIRMRVPGDKRHGVPSGKYW